MSMPRSPSVPTMRGSSVSSAPMRSAADGSLIADPSCSRPAYPSPRKRLLVAARAYGVAVAGVSRLASRRGGPRVAALSVWSLALFPASFVFSMTYPSAIFLAASVWAFVLVEEHHDLAAGLVAVGAALVRPNGLVLAVAL